MTPDAVWAHRFNAGRIRPDTSNRWASRQTPPPVHRDVPLAWTWPWLWASTA